jgi:hypothetical protein
MTVNDEMGWAWKEGATRYLILLLKNLPGRTERMYEKLSEIELGPPEWELYTDAFVFCLGLILYHIQIYRYHSGRKLFLNCHQNLHRCLLETRFPSPFFA